MSQSEAAADRLRQCLSELIPSLLATLSDLRSANPQQQLLPFTQVHNALKATADTQAVREALGLVPTLSTAEKDGPEVRLRNLCLELSNNELRRAVLENPAGLDAAQGASTDDEDLRSRLAATFDRLDAVVVLALHDLIDQQLPLSLIEELIGAQPISTCSRIFGYTESRVKPLTIDLHPGKGKGPILLRTCNELLKRLSKPSQEHTVFAGRILSLLAKVIPLGDRSGVNLRGDFNVENQTYIEERTEDAEYELNTDADADERDQIFKVDYEFYKLFWKVQRFFSNPPLLMGAQDSSRPSTRNATPAEAGDSDRVNTDEDPAPDGAKGAMSELRISTAKILKLFSAVTKREKELAGAASAEDAHSGGNKGLASQAASGTVTPSSSKRRLENGTANTGYIVGKLIDKNNNEPAAKRLRPDIVDGIRTNDFAADDDMEAEVATAESGHFFPTYLTGRKLFEYEIRDTSFRKHILVQYLVLFQYLLSFTPTAKESWKVWKNKALQALFTLEDADERWIRSTWREIQALIREIPPDGRHFLESVLEVLKRETNWIRWKTESCPSIEKPPLSPEQIAQFASARALLLRKPEPYPHKLGTAALSELWQDGLRPPVPGTRREENEMGEYVTVATDGLEELEIFPAVPSLDHYSKSIQREKMKLDMRKKQLSIDPAQPDAKLSKAEQAKLDSDERAQGIIETMQSLAWRALRIASRDNLHLFGKLDRPENIEGLLKVMEEERNPKPKPVRVLAPKSADEVAAKAEEETANAMHDGSEQAAVESAETGAQEIVPEPIVDGSTATAAAIQTESAVGTTAQTTSTAISAAGEEASDVPIVLSTVPSEQTSQQEEGTAPTDASAERIDAAEEATVEVRDPNSASEPPAVQEHDVEMTEASS